MKCLDLQSDITLYADGFLDDGITVAIKNHLEICPLCRQKVAEYREISSSLRSMRRPKISASLQNKLKNSHRSQILVNEKALVAMPGDVREWLQMRVISYGVGVVASVLVGVTFLTIMFSGMLRPVANPIAALPTDRSVMLASNLNPFDELDTSPISPLDYAQTRIAVASVSPSVNPQGALIALTRSLIQGGMKDDEVVVVADVFSSGLARVTEVVEPSRDLQAVGELKRALQSDSAYSPFVPSTMEVRPESVRVVLKFQSVDVRTGLTAKRRRL